MPIINGVYVNDTLPDSKTAQEQVFSGQNTRKDMSDYSQAAYNYLMKQQEQAYNLELWNLKNQYDSPAAQMQRYQDAGLNPNLIYSQQNVSGSTPSASAPSFRSSGNYNKSMQQGLNALNTASALVKNARDTYDYLKYGMEEHYWQNIATQEGALGQKLTNAWNDWLLHGDNMIYGDPSRLVSGPRATMYQNDIASRKNALDRGIFLLNNILPLQKEGQEALNKLRNNQSELYENKYSAILDLDLGLGDKVNQWAKLFLFFALARM